MEFKKIFTEDLSNIDIEIFKEELTYLVDLLDPGDYLEVSSLIVDLMDLEDEKLEEFVKPIFKNRKKGFRRFPQTKNQFKLQRIKNKVKNLKLRVKRRLYRRINKNRIKKYQKTYYRAIKRGLHDPKTRIGH